LRLNDLIDWFRGWCPRETLLGRSRLRKVSLNTLFSRLPLHERPLELLVTALVLTAGLCGFIIPNTFLPGTVEVWILTGSDLSLSGYVDGFEHRVLTPIMTPDKEAEAPIAVIYIWDEEGEREIEGVEVATALVSYPSHNITIIGDAHIGFDTLPHQRRHDVDMTWGELHYSVILSKDGLEREVGRGGGPPLEHFEVNLLSLEETEGVRPPFNLTCRGVVRHRLESSVISLRFVDRLTFWILHVEEESVMVTSFADLPKKELLVINPWLKIMREWRLILLTIGFLAVVLLYRAGKSTAGLVAKSEGNQALKE
jgi:hypothetical protein